MANVENYLAELVGKRWQFPNKKAYNPFVGYYVPEMDETPALEK